VFKLKIELQRLKRKNQKDSELSKKLTKKIQLQTQNLSEIARSKFGKNLSHEEYPGIKAFVVFEKCNERDNIYKKF
jgi:hypothetical protein